MNASQRTGDTRASSQVGIVLATVFLAYLGQTTLNPVIAPLSREVGLDEWQIGVTISVAAIMVVLTSQIWGRRSQSWGRKPVLIASLATCTAAMTLFAIIAALGVGGNLSKTPLFILFVLVRGMLFGTALAAILPTAQAYVADITSSEEERVRGMAGVGERCQRMTVYRELIERQLAVRQAGLQIGLQKANEQEPFIAAVAETLSRTMWGYVMRMDARFEVTFVVNLGYVAFEHQFAAVKQALAEKFEVEADGDALTVESDRMPYGMAACRVVFGEV